SNRHARPRARLGVSPRKKDVDSRDKPGHDGRRSLCFDLRPHARLQVMHELDSRNNKLGTRADLVDRGLQLLRLPSAARALVEGMDGRRSRLYGGIGSVVAL